MQRVSNEGALARHRIKVLASDFNGMLLLDGLTSMPGVASGNRCGTYAKGIPVDRLIYWILILTARRNPSPEKIAALQEQLKNQFHYLELTCPYTPARSDR